ncbi:MAG: family 16 glycoside hydrolase [Planctomycetota bacterium]
MVVRLSLLLVALPLVVSPRGSDSPGEPVRRAQTEQLFDGQSLDGWRGDERLWSVEGGAIKGSTVDARIAQNSFLIWEGGEVADFELVFEAKFTPTNNSGVQYRAELFDGVEFALAGNQCDLHPNPPYLAMLYSERDRGILAQRGTRVVIGEGGKPRVVGETNAATPIDVEEWHRYRIVARGRHLLHQIDGVTTVDVIDDDPNARMSGLLGLQLHAGAPMTAWFRDLQLTRLAPAAEEEPSAVEEPELEPPHWVWAGASDGDQAWFRHEFELSSEPARAAIRAAGDNHLEVFLNGERVLENHEWWSPSYAEVRNELRRGRNVLAVRGWNDGGPAALALRLDAAIEGGERVVLDSGSHWRATASEPAESWVNADFDDSSWSSADDYGVVGAPDVVWSSQVDASQFGGAGTEAFPQTSSGDAGITTLPGFVAEVVYEVPRSSQGSWVSLAALPDGRLIASDQGNKGLFVITPSAWEEPGSVTTVERLDVDLGDGEGLGGVQGMQWAFDSLYVMVNGRRSGLYRIADEDDDGRLDQVRLLREFRGAGEHGPHAVRLSLDGESLIVCAGNHTLPPEVDASRIPTNWEEDLLLPRQWDARGHARGRLAPGGWIARVSPDGEQWEMLSVGYRNEYDFAFHKSGEMFTYDADMEWDMGTPWYRPTRVCHATSGSEFGWRSGTGKWPSDYPDSLPSVIDLGPGSPSGMTFGYGAKFPMRYQEALFGLDWTFGTIWAIHLTPDGASFRATREEFATGTPLALTDALVGADGALYFTVGGRGSQSKLYRMRYVGEGSTVPMPGLELTPELALRRELEAFHGKADPKALDVAWPHLGHPDRFVAYAARIAVESQPVDQWRARALSEEDPLIATNALLALARQGEGAEDRDALLRRLMTLRGPFRGELGIVSRLRTAGVAMARHGMPDESIRLRMIELLENNLRRRSQRVHVEMVKLLAYLGSESIVERAVPLLAAAQPSEPPAWSELIERNDNFGGPIRAMLADMPPLEGIDLAFAIRHVEAGWTIPLRRQYFEFLNRAAERSGGISYAGFLTNCREDALEHCTPSERAACADLTGELLGKHPDFEVTPPRGPGQLWTVDSALEVLESSASVPDFERGRNAFHAVACATCHSFDGSGGAIGPDLSTVANKFGNRDLLTAILEPSADISDQYGSSVVTLKDGSKVFGRAVPQEGGGYEVYPMDPTADPVVVPASDVDRVEESPVSQMPAGLTYALGAEELRDLIAYLMSAGDRDSGVYRR